MELINIEKLNNQFTAIDEALRETRELYTDLMLQSRRRALTMNERRMVRVIDSLNKAINKLEK